jgi:hypothetical protein
MKENKTLLVVGKRQYIRPVERARILAEWEASGLRAVEFAQQRGLDKRSIYRWRAQVRRAPARELSLVEVPAPRTGAWAAEVMTVSGPLRLSLAASPRWAGQLIRELGRC